MNDQGRDDHQQKMEQLANKIEEGILKLRARIPTETEVAVTNGEVERFVAAIYGRFNLKLSPMEACVIWDYFAAFDELPNSQKWSEAEWESNIRILFNACCAVFAEMRTFAKRRKEEKMGVLANQEESKERTTGAEAAEAASQKAHTAPPADQEETPKTQSPEVPPTQPVSPEIPPAEAQAADNPPVPAKP